jgi:uncharacterized cupin superfamily protein
VSVAKVNVIDVEFDERLDEAGFRHVAATVGGRLGARRIGASVYRAEAGLAIWPYHYHHGIEEWLYVIAGAPVLRELAGDRTLAPGDVVCFPTGRLGAHTVKGPGSFVIFSSGQHVEPWMSVYPDSDKVSGPEGILLRSSAVGYWHREGTAGSQAPDEVARDAETPPPRPAVNVSALPTERPDPHAPVGSRNRAVELSPLLGADRLGGTVIELHPREGSEPYHYVHGQIVVEKRYSCPRAGAVALVAASCRVVELNSTPLRRLKIDPCVGVHRARVPRVGGSGAGAGWAGEAAGGHFLIVMVLLAGVGSVPAEPAACTRNV